MSDPVGPHNRVTSEVPSAPLELSPKQRTPVVASTTHVCAPPVAMSSTFALGLYDGDAEAVGDKLAVTEMVGETETDDVTVAVRDAVPVAAEVADNETVVVTDGDTLAERVTDIEMLGVADGVHETDAESDVLEVTEVDCVTLMEGVTLKVDEGVCVLDGDMETRGDDDTEPLTDMLADTDTDPEMELVTEMVGDTVAVTLRVAEGDGMNDGDCEGKLTVPTDAGDSTSGLYPVPSSP
jgi:hypothetical protein